MGILSNTVVYGKTISMGDINCDTFNAYGSVLLNGSPNVSVDFYGTADITGNASSIYVSSTATKMYPIKTTTYSTTSSELYADSTIYVDSSGYLHATTFSGTANNATRLGTINYDKYATSTSRRQWWKCANTLGDGLVSMIINGCIPNIFHGMGNNYSTAASSTNIKKGDYVFDDVGHIGVVAVTPTSNSVSVTTVWQPVRTWTCLEEGTLITMADGSQKPIEDVRDGEMIMGYDFEKNEPTPSVVLLNTITSDEDHANYFIFDNGDTINCTDCHEFYSVDKGRSCWVDEVSEGERFLNASGEITTLRAIHKRVFTYDRKQFYQLISSNNTYYANNILNSLRPHMKYNWLVEYMKKELPDELFEIFNADAEEYTSLSFLARNDDFRKESINNLENAKLIYKRLCELKDYLKETDYVSFKQMEGIDVDENILNKRQQARNEINILEKIVSEDYNPDLDAMMKSTSPLGDDVLMPLDQKLSKYFHKACKRDNDNLNLFKKYFCTNNEEE